MDRHEGWNIDVDLEIWDLPNVDHSTVDNDTIFTEGFTDETHEDLQPVFVQNLFGNTLFYKEKKEKI